MTVFKRVLSSCLAFCFIFCVFLSSISLPASAANYYTFGGLTSSVVVKDNTAYFTVDIPFFRMYVADENLTYYKIDQGDFFTFYPDHHYTVALTSKNFRISDFPIDYISSVFLLSPSGAAYNADFSDFDCDVKFYLQFRDANNNYIGNYHTYGHYSSGYYSVSLIPEHIPANAVYFDFVIQLANFYVHTSSDSSDYCFWMDKFEVTSIVDRNGVFSRVFSLYDDSGSALIEQFIFSDENYNCGPVWIDVFDDGIFVTCNDETRTWHYNDVGVFNGIRAVVDGSEVFLAPGDSYIFNGSDIEFTCDAEFSSGDNFISSISKFVSATGDFFAHDPFSGLLNAITNFRKEVSSFFSGLVDSIANFFASIPDMMAPVIAPIQNWISSIGDNISNLGSSLVESLGIPSWISGLSDIISNNFITDAFLNLWDWLSSVVDFFSVPVTYDSANLTFWDYLLGRTGEDGTFWDYQDDAGFLAGISNFYSSVVDVWNAFPVPVRYLVMFGFCLPVSLGVIKSFLR